ncbi:MAG: HAD family hydrolase [Odoribacteraceae bacterium]|jgi:D-glycero-D-manno-heptose 1,7-bisphosphate phosphatase|nr:HAD family hydrolase [Odoribacteraceae bacterium]
MGRAAVFLDRDGTINSDEGLYYVFRPEDFRFNPGVVEGIRRLNEAGFLVFVVTNQGGVAKGLYSAEQVEAVHAFMREELAKGGARVDGVFFCPHHESVAACRCRKPSPYFIEMAMREFDVDPAKACMIGDSQRDVDAAAAAGIAGVRVEKNGDLAPVIDRVLAGRV